MNDNNKRNFTLMQLLTWAAWAAFGQFYTFYLVELGYTSTEIGLAITLFTIMGVIGQYVFGVLSDYNKTIKKVYLVIILITNLSIIAFSFFVESKIGVYITLSCIGFSWLPKASILDSWLMSSRGINQNDYGKFRWFGSLGYALVASVFGKVIGLYGYNIMFIVFIGISLVEIYFVLSTPDIAVSHEHHESVHPLDLFKNKLYVLLVIFAILVGTGKFMILNFYPFVFTAVGGTQFQMGLAAAITAMVEIPLFIISGKVINRFKPIRLLLVSAIIYLIRIILTWFAVNPTQLIIAAAIQALGFAYIMATGRILVARIAPPTLKTTAQGIFTAAFFSVSGIISSTTGGFLINNYGMNAYYLAASLFTFLGVVLMLAINVMSGRERKHN